MRARFLIAAALLLAVPSLAEAADMSVEWSPGCGGLQPVDEYVPPQTAYIVACTVPLPAPGVIYSAPKKHAILRGLGELFGHGSADEPVATVDWRYGNPATHEGKLVYLQKWSADRPPVHFLVVPK